MALLAGCAVPAGSASESVGPASSTPATSVASPASGRPSEAVPSLEAGPPLWAELATDGPSPREDHTWTVDTDGTAYLFGGRDGGTAFADLWAYELATDTWVELAVPQGPPARFGHEAAWVDGVGLVIFAGQAGTTFFNDLWAYDPIAGAWRDLPATGDVPVSRYGSCSAVGSDGRLWISHGFTSDGVRFADTRAYDFAAGEWTDETPASAGPVERCLHACWITDSGGLALYAGQTTGVPALGDLWTFADGSWEPAVGDLPPARQLTAHVRLDGSALVFGGQSTTAPLADLWLFPDEGGAVELRASNDGPSPRYGAAMIHDPTRERVLLFGGRDAEQAHADLWSLTDLPH